MVIDRELPSQHHQVPHRPALGSYVFQYGFDLRVRFFIRKEVGHRHLERLAQSSEVGEEDYTFATELLRHGLATHAEGSRNTHLRPRKRGDAFADVGVGFLYLPRHESKIVKVRWRCASGECCAPRLSEPSSRFLACTRGESDYAV